MFFRVYYSSAFTCNITAEQAILRSQGLITTNIYFTITGLQIGCAWLSPVQLQVAGWGQVWSTFLHSGTQVEQAAASQAARNLPWLLKSSAQTSTLAPLSTFYWPKQITWPSLTSKGQESRPLLWNLVGESEYFLKNNLPNRQNIYLATT